MDFPWECSAKLTNMNSAFIRVKESTLIQSLALLLLLSALPVQQVRKPTGLWDPDIWWHMRVGHWILQHHSVPHTGIFSQIGQDRSWAAYSWGFEVIAALLQQGLGIKAMPIFVMIFGILFTLALFLLLRHLSGGFWWAWLLTLATVWGANLNTVGTARPVQFSLAFFTLELWLIFSARREGNKKFLYVLPALFFVWANFHIQFIYGLFLPGLLALVETLTLWARKRGWSWGSVASGSERFAPKFLWAIFLGCVAATLLNPYGILLYKTILVYLRSSYTYQVITELQAIDFRDSANYTQLMLMAAAFFALGRRRLDAFKLAMLVIVSLVAFRTLRDAWFVCLVSGVIIADSLRPQDEAEAAILRPSGMFKLGQIGAILAGVICVVLLSAADAGLNTKRMLDILHNSYPVDASIYVEEHRPPGPLFNNFNWGGFLIAALPDYPVSIDGRNDLYGDEMLRREVQTIMGVDWANDPTVQRANLVLIPVALPLCSALEQSGQFKVAYSDSVAKVLVRTRQP